MVRMPSTKSSSVYANSNRRLEFALSGYSRRQFLQIAGISIVGSQLSFPKWLDINQAVHIQARALAVTPVYSHPHLDAPIVTRLWPDSVAEILNSHGNWYRLPQGFVEEIALQPMTIPTTQSHPIDLQAQFWGEVVGPVAIVREWCAADAPLFTRIGYGGVARIIGSLADDNDLIWHEIVSENEETLGWTQASQWQPALPTDRDNIEKSMLSGTQPYLEIDLSSQQLTAFEDEHPILQAKISTGESIAPGIYPVQKHIIGGRKVTLNMHTFHAVPWITQFGESYEIGGVYWHNRFGASHPGTAIQTTPFLAKWLHTWLGEKDLIRVIS